MSLSALLTTINAHYGRVGIHGLRKDLLMVQTDGIRLPREIIWLPERVSNATYEDTMGAATSKLMEQSYTYAGFGDISREDLRTYREQQLNRVRPEGCIPTLEA